MSFRFTVDEAHNKDNNEYFRDGRRLRLSAAIMTVLLWGAGGLILFLWGDSGLFLFLGILAITFGAMCAWVAVKLPGVTGSPQEIYDTWPLAPAMIAEVDERTMTLMALVDANVEAGPAPKRALTVRTVTKIAGAPRRVGARVPSVAVAGRRRNGGGAWDEVTPVPIAWATPATATVREAERAIPEGEWQLLQANIDRVADVRATKFNLLSLEK